MNDNLPECHLNTCKHYYDGNCTNLIRRNECIYAKQCESWLLMENSIERLCDEYRVGNGFILTEKDLLKHVLQIIKDNKVM